MRWPRPTTFLVALLAAAGLAAPPEARAAATPIRHPAQVSAPVKMDVSPALRSIPPLKVVPEGKKAPENPPIPRKDRAIGNGATGVDAALQQAPGATNMPAPLSSFEGVHNTFGVLPPDTQGDVGPNHYIQWVNLGFAIFDKTGAQLYPASGSALGNTIWTGFGGPCEADNDGDPQTNYDHLADRWVMSQFALPNYPNGPFYQCFAVSQTPDPLGQWYRYQYTVSATKLNDYPKIGVWPDGYYMTVNQFVMPAGNWGGLGVFVYERDQMLTGGVARQIYFDTGAVTGNYGGATPADLDGLAPPPGTPGYVMEWDDSTWIGDPTDTLRIWEVHADWTNPANSTFGTNASYDPNFKLATADAVPLCINNRACISQPGTTAKLDAIGDRLMQRLQYRLVGGVPRLTTNMTVDAGSGRAGVRWYQLADSGTGWTLADQGTFAGDPGDTDSRWMGSAALDVQGNMAVGYSAASATTFPSIRYNGRLAGDPAGTLGAEATLIAGTGSQTHSSSRWGDYSALSVDPTDECTFWYTQEYYQTTGSANWQTRIGTFKFPGCVAGPSGVIEGYVKSTAGGAGIPGAHVQVGPSISTTTNAAGFYQLTVPVGTYDVTASKFGYDPATITGQDVTDGGTTTVADLMLTPVGTYAVDGFVTAADHNWPLWARIEIRQAGNLVNTIYTSPWNGYYETPGLPNGYTYDFTVHSMYDGYQDEVRSVTLTSGDQSQNFTLLAASGNPAYTCYLDGGINESFEGGFPPLGWTVKNNGAGPGNVWKRNDQWGSANLTGGTGFSADADSDKAGSGSPGFDTELWTPPIHMPATPRNLKFKQNFNWIASGDVATVDVSTTGGATWTNLLTFTADNTAEQTINMSAYANQTIMLRWHYVSTSWAWYWQIDDVRTETIPPPPPPPALVWTENFDGVTAPAWPANWSVVDTSGTAGNWTNATTSVHPTGVTPHSAANMAIFNSWTASTGNATRLQKNTGEDISTGTGYVSFWMYHECGLSASDTVQVQTSTDGGTTWVNAGSPVARCTGTTGWAQHQVVLTGVSGASVRIGLNAVSAFGNDIHVDDVQFLLGAAVTPAVVDNPTLLCNAVGGSLVAGFVTDANTTNGVVGAQVVRDLGGTANTAPATGNLPAGFYYMFSPTPAPAAPNGPSTRTFTASKTGYGTVQQSVNLVPDTINRLDFALPAASLSLAGWPFVVDGRLTPDGQPVSEKTQLFSILNTGGLGANVKLQAQALGSGYVPPRPLQPRGESVLAPLYVAKNLFSLKGVPQTPRPAKPTPPRLTAGDVLASWSTGLALPWGAGITGATVWASNPGAGGGDDYDHEYTAAGTPTGRKVQAVFGGSWAADMTRADGNGMLWQVNVGGDNCIYEVNPNVGATGNKICPAFATSQRGLAYDPDTDTFFAGNWTDTTIYRFNRAGTILQQVNSGYSVSGLAYNPATQHLFVMENSPTDTVHVLDVANGYSVFGAFTIAGFGNYSGAGIEFGCDGLWAINQNDGKAYLVDAGEAYPCNPNLPWFTMTPTEGPVPAGGQLDVLGEFFPEGVAPAHFGLFRAVIKSTNDTPVPLPDIPVYFTKAFWDVPHGYWADAFIHALAGARITRGCGSGNFCPDTGVTRAEMAVTMVRAIHGPDFAPPPAVGIFADVVISDTDNTADYIEQLYNDGIVAGCQAGPPRLYCPNDLVNRAQMSVFIVAGLNMTPVVPPTGYFTDVTGGPYDWAAPFAEALFNAGITAGCGDHIFCPATTITRAQLSVWLVTGLGIPYYIHP